MTTLRSKSLVLVALAACSSSTPSGIVGVSSANVEVADNLADEAIVLGSEIDFPIAGHQDLLSLPVGHILVAGGSGTNRGNPDGFLRSIVSVVTDGDVIRIQTRQASLTDAIVQGELSFTSNNPASATSATPVHLQTIGGLVGGDHSFTGDVVLSQTDLLGNTGTLSTNKVAVQENVKIIDGSLSFTPQFDSDLQIADAQVQLFRVFVAGEVDAKFAMQIDVEGDVDIEADLYQELKPAHSRQRLFTFPKVSLPPQLIGLVPVYESVEVSIDFGCDFEFKGEVHATAGIDLKGAISAGGQYQNGQWTALGDGPSLAVTPTFDPSLLGTVSVICYVEPIATLLFYDVAGPYIGVGPYLDLEIQKDNTGTTWGLYPGVAVEVGGDFELFDREMAFGSIEVFDWHSSSPLVGSTNPPSP